MESASRRFSVQSRFPLAGPPVPTPFAAPDRPIVRSVLTVLCVPLVLAVLLSLATGCAPAPPGSAPSATSGGEGTGSGVTTSSASPPSFQLSPDLQHDVIAPHAGAAGLQPSVNELAWTSFIALNWPASPEQRGVANRDNVTGGQQPDPEGGSGQAASPTVWETFKETSEIFLDPPTKPAAWNTPQPVPPQCPAVEVPSNVSGVPSPKTVVTNQLYENIVPFTNSPLIDQNGKDVWFEVRVNRPFFDFIVDNGYYDSRNQPKDIFNAPKGSNLTAKVGSIVVKAAWKELGKGDDPTHFYTTEALILPDGPTGSCRKALMGLVGLHIVHKTATRPEWVWATFEQVDNAPTQGAVVPTGAHFSFNDPSCTTCKVNQEPAAGSSTPVQVERVIPIPDDVAQLNAEYQAGLVDAGNTLNSQSVWQYYELVNAQWPADPPKRKIYGGPMPQFLANTTLETYFQTPDASVTPPHSCMGCHGQYAQKKDFIFALYKACPAGSGCGGTIELTGPEMLKSR